METPPTSHLLSGKKVLFGVTKSNWGGAQAYVATLAEQAQKAGADVAVMAGGASGKGSGVGRLFSELEKRNIRTIPLLGMQRDIGAISEWGALKELINVLRLEKPDVIHLNSSKMGLLGAIAARIAGVRTIVFTAHGWPYLEPRSLLWKLVALGGAWVIGLLSTTVIAVSDSDVRSAPIVLSRRKLVHIPNGVQPASLKSLEEARSYFNTVNPKLTAYSTWTMMIAELHPNKGISTAIRALAELAEEYPDLILVVCGEGQDRKPLTDLAEHFGVSSRVFLLGFVADAQTYLNAGNVYLMPSRKEGLPLALLEAALASRPIIATNIGGIPDVIEDQKTGLFMPRDNTQILAKAIEYLLENPERAAKMGSAACEKVRTEYSVEQMVSKTFTTYTP